AVFAAPRFVASRVIKEMRDHPGLNTGFNYSPWMVANVSLNSLPEGVGAPLSWDNVFYHSESLGYVGATHQDLKSRPKETVLTHYWPLSSQDTHEARS